MTEPIYSRNINEPVHLPVDRTKVSEGKARMDNQRAAGARSMPEMKMVVRSGRKKRRYKFPWPDPEELTEN